MHIHTCTFTFTFILHTVEWVLALFQHILVWLSLYGKVNEDYKSLICIIFGKAERCFTVRCWNSHALMMLVATLGKMPLFLWFFLSLSGSSSSPVLGDATLWSRKSPGERKQLHRVNRCEIIFFVFAWAAFVFISLRCAFKCFRHHLKGVMIFQRPSNKCKSIFSLVFIFH